jgi:hypothetical protein
VPTPGPSDPAEPPAATPPPPAATSGPAAAAAAGPGRRAAIVDAGHPDRRHHRELRANRREPRTPLAGPWGGKPQSAGRAGNSIQASKRHPVRHAAEAAAPAASPTPASCEPPAGPPGGGTRFPWLPAGLLLVAAVCAFLGLREGHANHLRTSEDRV